jgi:sialidase-1
MQNNKDQSKMIARSLDNGDHWNEYDLVAELTTPVCQSSIIYIPESDHLYHLGPASTEKREQLTLWKSSDRGRSWNVLEIVEAGFAAYSDLLQLSRTELGLLYESADYDQIIFKRIEINLVN